MPIVIVNAGPVSSLFQTQAVEAKHYEEDKRKQKPHFLRSQLGPWLPNTWSRVALGVRVTRSHWLGHSLGHKE